MTKIWSDESRFQIWLEIETLALEKMVEEGNAPKQAYEAVRSKGKFSTERVLEIEKEVKHDVIAFLTNVAENVGPLSRYTHRGMTSSDVLDTCLAVQLNRSGKMILKGVEDLIESTKKRAEQYKHLACIGRSHGIHAEPTTFGVKLISWHAELKRHKKRVQAALDSVSVGKISGPVGTYATVSPGVEAHVMQRLGLTPETVSSQIVQRDRHAEFFMALAGLATSIEKFSTEVRHLQRTEVREAEERFTKGQKGSSAMPHKRNPILTENLCGLARLLRSYAVSALENVPLWHERDISHSSVERVIAPDACILMDFMLSRFKSVVDEMVVYEERVKQNLDLSRGLIFSGSLLVALVDSGVTREDAYRLVQKHALSAWEGGATFPERVMSDKEISDRVGKERLAQAFDLARHLKHVDFIFERAIKE